MDPANAIPPTIRKPISSEPQGRHWCGTVNNPRPEHYACFVGQQHLFTYYIYANEVGQQGTPHLQFYFCLATKKKLSPLRKLLPGFHLEIMRGTVQQNVNYCKKGKQPKAEWDALGTKGPTYGFEAEFQEYGIQPLEQTEAATYKNKELYDDTMMKAREGNFDAIISRHQLQYYATLQRINREFQARNVTETLNWKDGNPPNVWYYGKTGVGKSRRAREENPGAYLKMLNKWWDRYEYQPYVIIEEVELVKKINLFLFPNSSGRNG